MKVKILSKKSKREIVYENITEIIVTPTFTFLKKEHVVSVSLLNNLVKLVGVIE